MTLAEVLPSARALKRADKLRLIQVLAGDVAGEGDLATSEPSSIPIWSPHDAGDGAAMLLK